MGNAIIIEPVDLGTVTAEGSAAGTSPSFLNNDYIGVVHRGTATTTGAVVNVDLGSSQTLDTIAFLSAGTSVSNWTALVGTSAGSGSLYTSGSIGFAAGAALPTSGRQNSLLLLPTPVTGQFWSNSFGTLAGAPFEAGRLVLGRRLTLARNFSFGAAFGALDRGGGSFNNRGVWLPVDGVIHRTLGLTWNFVTRQEAEEQVQPMNERIGNGKFILVVTDPDADAQRQRRMYFGPLTGNIETVWATAAGFQLRANLVSVI